MDDCGTYLFTAKCKVTPIRFTAGISQSVLLLQREVEEAFVLSQVRCIDQDRPLARREARIARTCTNTSSTSSCGITDCQPVT